LEVVDRETTVDHRKRTAHLDRRPLKGPVESRSPHTPAHRKTKEFSKMKPAILTSVALFAAVLMIVPSVTAGTIKYYTDNTGDHSWFTAGNWSSDPFTHSAAGSIPGEGDRAVIQSGGDCYIDDPNTAALADTLCVESGGRLYINDDCVLELDADNGPEGSHCINGEVYLRDSDSELRFIDTDQTLSWCVVRGRIVGQHDNALITVSAGETLTSEITIEGALEIRAGSGTFDNDYVVEAKKIDGSNETLTLYSGTFSGGSGMYKVNDADAELWVYATGTPDCDGMSADFYVGAGVLDVDYNVCTTGYLTFLGGSIEVDSGNSFKAGGSCP
jgi:hypothetical protein